MLRHVVFHLNILTDPLLLRSHYQEGLARIMQERYGKSQSFWVGIQAQIFADWASYHADLNFSGDEGMKDMLEGRFRVTRALFRLAEIPEPSKNEISQLADDLISQAPKSGNAFFDEAQDMIKWLYEKNIPSAIVSYYPASQLKAILIGGCLEEKIAFVIGADTFEHYEMDRRYFEYLLNKINVQASDCLYVDNQTTVLETAKKIGMQTAQIIPSAIVAVNFKELRKIFES